ncbi:hypothetical protein N864_10625 [Intrasporangium chromatireducens Q5-1]|uniref:GmrSD restriction endonucleases N-terminal domain-containing protein n=1 Tax=Intrasporangium chromatireducens Q5-1 TaxID=584657 RepID=W9GIK3_9MICO|nr:DUF262 domain-containing protein [Intrasporangium chromatireducens]EWT04638.1 hypothetical protein N864_10625 [Intrasporangium chromatireducens Q5-1]
MTPTDSANATATLEDELREARRTISTDSYPMSIGELTNLFREGELVIRPAFQRLFRWEDDQKSLLVESILLGIPLPSIFVAQDATGRWELIDGLQRVSTILQLQGLLDPEQYPPLVLQGTKYLKKLEGRTWDGSPEDALTDAQKLDVKRSKIDVKIIKRESSEETKYDLFQRLNSYGSTLSAQEIRNAVLVAVNPNFVEWIQQLAKRDSFVETTMLTDKDVAAKYDEDLVLRFLWLHRQQDTSTASLRQFQEKLEEQALAMARVHDQERDQLEEVFGRTFDLLAAEGRDRVFRKWDRNKGRFTGGFLNTAYEVLAMGLGYRIANQMDHRSDILDAAKELWGQPDMNTRFATGKATEQRLALMLPKGRQLLAPAAEANDGS